MVRSLTARRVRLALALASVLCCAGCNDYLSRRDTATLESGEAVQTNMAIHVIDPSPPASTRIVNNTDGERLQRGIERYRNPQAGLGGFGAPAAVPIGASAVPPVGNSLSR